MDGLFKELIESDNVFKSNWIKTPFLYCEETGSSHTLASYNFRMEKDSTSLKKLLKDKPPYVLKLGSNFAQIFPNLESNKFKKSNVFFAIEMSQRNFIYKHHFSKSLSLASPINNKPLLLRLIRKYIKKILNQIPKFKTK